MQDHLSDPIPDADDGDDDRPSKTQRKKAMHELQALGEALVALPTNRSDALDLPESLRDALKELRRTRTFEGKRRQMQYIGKLMRKVDPEPIREAVAAFELGQARDVLSLHKAEAWRNELVHDDEALKRWLTEYPGTDVQQLRSLIRAARKDAAAAPEQRSGRAFRELFQFIKQQIQEGGGNEQQH